MLVNPYPLILDNKSKPICQYCMVKDRDEFKIWTKISLTILSTYVDWIDSSLVTHYIQVAEIDVIEIIRKHYFVKTSLLNEKFIASETQSNEIQVIVITTP